MTSLHSSRQATPRSASPRWRQAMPVNPRSLALLVQVRVPPRQGSTTGHRTRGRRRRLPAAARPRCRRRSRRRASRGLGSGAARLLEAGELRHFHAVEPYFPAEAPGTQGGGFPVVFHEAHVVNQRVEP